MLTGAGSPKSISPDVSLRAVSNSNGEHSPETDRSANRLTLELSGSINREAIDLSA
jgi:hypothetical protein